jgi:ribosomal protein S18 acetylase RimI-like enzyme
MWMGIIPCLRCKIDAQPFIRAATPQDAGQAVLLLVHALADAGDFIFGDGSREKALVVLRSLFIAKQNRFNFRNTFLVEQDKQITGLLLAFNSNLAKRLDLLTGQRLVGRVIRQTPLKESAAGEYYISDLAVAPESRGQQIGSKLLAFAEEQARNLGLEKCSLVVVHENEAAKRLYLRHGYKIIDFIKNSRLKQLKGAMGYYRMVKEI